MKKVIILPLVVIVLGIALYLSFETKLIYVFSQQDKINPDSLSSVFNNDASKAIYNNREVPLPSYLASDEIPKVLGEVSAAKRIEVDLTNQRLYAYEGDRLVYNFLISSGKWSRTPSGTFRIWTKLRYVKMSGGSKALGTYYYLPNVPYTMFFANEKIPKSRGYALHGTYWHSNFGHPMSHGCINMKTEEAGLLYNWANPDLGGAASIAASQDNPGTEVVIYGTAPPE